MLTKFESKSNRVKGLAFHSHRPWVLTSLHNGVIQLWDYRMGTLLDRFDEHDGPVRGVDFHKVQPLICSGGDDYRIKVWDYKLRRCLFTLLGHLDYIRTVCFHSDYPWLVSASDDQTIRIWNWQSRSCVSVLTGHNHYVMCASFHAKDDLIVSASLDQTVRVWDITGLRKKTVRGAPGGGDAAAGAANVVSRVNADLFGGNDAVVKYVLEGHDRGVNWAAFHPTLPLVISGADDRQVKLWRMNETKAWEVDTMRGHTNNVSCVVFHPKHELIVSNSEDRSIRVWDISKRLGVQTFRRENDRFWILAAHPEQNLLAAGHDSGMIVFKLERERPAYASVGGRLLYVKDKYLRTYDYANGRDVPSLSLRRAGHGNVSGIGGNARSLEYNLFSPTEDVMLLFSDADGGSYELISFKPEAGGAAAAGAQDATDVKRGHAASVTFLARNRFAILDKNRQIIIKDFNNEKRKAIPPPNASTDRIFYAGTSGRLLLRSEDRITLFEPQSRRVLAELQAPRVKYVHWNADASFVALVSKHGITVANRELDQLCSVTETVRVKSGMWDTEGRVFVYTTLNHIKYALCNGDTGIIRTLDVPVYITRVHDRQVHCLDREGKTRTIAIDNTEAVFKLALEDKDFGAVMAMVRTTRLCGKALIVYLQDKGFPEVALHFVEDLPTRFKLALACGNIEIAMNTAYEMGDDQCWHRLGVEALRQGNHQVVEMAYQRTKNFERLSFLYLLTGNTDKLRKMLKIAEMRGDTQARFHNALFLGDAQERVKVLEEAGQTALAYLTAATHGLQDDVQRLGELAEAAGKPLPSLDNVADAQLIQPPTPILRADNWPLLTVSKSALYDRGNGAEASAVGASAASANDEPISANDWGDDLDLDDDDHGAEKEDGGEPGGWDDDLDLGDDDDDGAAPATASGGDFAAEVGAMPALGPNASMQWIAQSSHAADHVAAGSFESAMQLLHRQIAAVQFVPLKARFLVVLAASGCVLPGFPLSRSNSMPLSRRSPDEPPSKAGELALPIIAVKMANLVETLKSAYKLFQKGQFKESKDLFQDILLSIPLVVASNRAEAAEVKELLEISREYVTAVRIKLLNGTTAPGPRQMELSAYFTHCRLQPAHLVLALNLAMAQAYKGSNFIHAAAFARRVLELPEASSSADIRNKASMVLKKSEQQARNEQQLAYDERNPFTVDCFALAPLYRGLPAVACAFCGSTYAPDGKGKVCATCSVAAVGVETLGLVSQSAGAGRK